MSKSLEVPPAPSTIATLLSHLGKEIHCIFPLRNKIDYDAFNASVIMCWFLRKSILYSCPPLSATPRDELIHKSVDCGLKDKWKAVGVQGSQLHL